MDDSSAATDVYGPIEGWDVSGVTNMFALFCSHQNCGAKKKVLAAGFDGDLSKWNVGKVSTMHYSKYSFLPPCLVVAFHILSNPDTRAFSPRSVLTTPTSLTAT